jgi:hypothetical protein
MVEMLDLLAENKIFEQRRSPHAGFQADLVPHGATNIRRHVAAAVVYLILVKEVIGLGILPFV